MMDNEHPNVASGLFAREQETKQEQERKPKCTCEQPHYTPMWWCAVHGEVVVPMD